MGLTNHGPRGSTAVDYDDIATRSSATNVFRWFKKAVGLGPAAASSKGRGPSSCRRGHRPRGLTFVVPKEIREPHDPHGVDTKPFFHTTGVTPNPTRTRSSTKLVPPHVLIVGGGIGGLCLAQGLKRAGIPFTVFEGDATDVLVSDGYHVHIDTSGYDALKVMLPDAAFERFLQSAGHVFPDTVQRDASTGKRIDGEMLRQTQGAKKQVFSMDRTILRSVLLHGLENGTEVKHKCVFHRYRVLGNKTVEVHFTNGMVVRGTVLIGADGTHSRVRDQLVPLGTDGLLNTDCCMLYGKTRVASTLACAATTTVITDRTAKISLRIEPLHAPTLAEHTSEPASCRTDRRPPNPLGKEDDKLFVSWALLARTDRFLVNKHLKVSDLETMAPSQLAEVARRMTATWHPRARAVVESQASAWCGFQPIHTTTPRLPAWSHSGVALVGDAAHAMAPARVGGTNLALEDAAMLCNRFVRMGVGLPALAMYEKQMRVTARDAVLASVDANHDRIGMPTIERMALAERADGVRTSHS